MAEKKKIAAQFAPRYRQAAKSEKSRILDEYLALCGGKSRKYAIFTLNRIGKTHLRTLDGQTVKVFIVEKSRKKRVYQPCYDTAVQHDGGNPSGEFADLRSDYTLTMTDDQGKTPFQRLLEQPFEDKLEEKRVKMAALALKGVTDVVEQKVKMDQAVDSLLSWAKHIGLY